MGGKDAGSKAADAQIEGLDKAIDLQREVQQQNRLDLGQSRFYGNAALRQMAGGELGLPDLGPLSYDPATGGVGLWGTQMASSPAPANTLAQLAQGGQQIGGDGTTFGWKNYGDDVPIWKWEAIAPPGTEQGRNPPAQAPVAAANPLAATQNPGAPPYGQSPLGQLGSGFQASPGYQFRLNEGLRAVQNSAAVRGMAGSGSTLKALNNYAQGQASSEYGNFYNRLAGLAGVGQQATNSLTNLNTQTGTEIGNLYQQQGNARASGYIQDANASNQFFGNMLNLGMAAASPFGPFSSVAAGGGRVGPLSGLFG